MHFMLIYRVFPLVKKLEYAIYNIQINDLTYFMQHMFK